VPVGGYGALHGGYELGGGLGFSADLGYFRLTGQSKGRAATLTPVGAGTGGLAPNPGVADDALRLSGGLVGASISYRSLAPFPLPLMARLGFGAALGSVGDDRSGTFTSSKGTSYAVTSSQSPGASYLYLAPDVRAVYRFGEHVDLSLGVTAFVLVALAQPKWADDAGVLTSGGDGLATFGVQSLTGRTLVVLVPSAGLRYAF
jgi:hypothetical protein